MEDVAQHLTERKEEIGGGWEKVGKERGSRMKVRTQVRGGCRVE